MAAVCEYAYVKCFGIVTKQIYQQAHITNLSKRAEYVMKKTNKNDDKITASALEEISEPQNREQIAALAHALWQARGCPDGSPQEDWFHAAE